MSRESDVVEEYVALQKSGHFWPRPESRQALVRKSYAQQFARTASETVGDRRQRAVTKAAIYNQLLPLLDLHASTQADLRRLYQRLLGGLAAALIVTSCSLVFLLV